MQLDKLRVKELNVQEKMTTDGGWDRLFEFQVAMTQWFIDNKNTKFVKDTFAGKDSYYP